MTEALENRLEFEPEHIKEEIKRYESRFEKVDEDHYKTYLHSREVIVPFVKEELFDKASRSVKLLFDTFKSEIQSDFRMPHIFPDLEGGIDIYDAGKGRNYYFELSMDKNGTANYFFEVNGEKYSGELD